MTRTQLLAATAALALTATAPLAQTAQDQTAQDQTAQNQTAQNQTDRTARSDQGAMPGMPADTEGLFVVGPDGIEGERLAAFLRALADQAESGTIATSDGAASGVDGTIFAPGGIGNTSTDGVIAEEGGTTERAGDITTQVATPATPATPDTRSDRADTADLSADAGSEADMGTPGLTRLNPDLTELARTADGATVGATDRAGPNAMTAQAQRMGELERFGEQFFERGFRSGYIAALEDVRTQQRARAAEADRLARMQALSQTTEAQQGAIIGSAQGQMGQGSQAGQSSQGTQQGQQPGAAQMPRILVVPQGTDMQALMRMLNNQGG
ncbi:MAG: hypothetical protein ACU0BF_07570 [Paracoccaceae bacterium]